jgi:Lipid A core - O-antigen ligase and related enzymes
MLMTRAAPQFGPKVLILATAFYIMLAPVIPSFLPNPFDPRSSLSQFYALSHIHRFMIWNTTVNHIKENPIIGHGLDTSRSLYSKNDRIISDVLIRGTSEEKKIDAEPIPLHPHNAILQIWLELGLVGATLLALFLIGLLNLVKKVTQNRWEAAACYGIFTSGLTISSLSYGIWQSWWLAGLLLSAVFAATTIQTSQIHDDLNKN